ncbi:histidine phosphatase family protein [Chimaeribacter arupi]|uniref:histidine phosphatase family protein n=1 Tax=Chimaeribacter arupi TaxID=2060066 RepID=UPI00294594F7|nr:histidine phosphatase family protein [Chimaeribacter arupi]MDV5139085.1 histidine phosphatase family protein [Chimaeribacter arupi]
MDIILMRHGKPSLNATRNITAGEMARWTEEYDQAETGHDTPPATSRHEAMAATCVVSSPLPRALSSLRALGLQPRWVEHLFREAELPQLHPVGLRLSPFHWALLLRLLWLCGYSRQAESRIAANQWAQAAAARLISLAEHGDGPVLVMGHGIMNRLIARTLRQQRWRERKNAGRGYWEAAIYCSPGK